MNEGCGGESLWWRGLGESIRPRRRRGEGDELALLREKLLIFGKLRNRVNIPIQ